MSRIQLTFICYLYPVSERRWDLRARMEWELGCCTSELAGPLRSPLALAFPPGPIDKTPDTFPLSLLEERTHSAASSDSPDAAAASGFIWNFSCALICPGGRCSTRRGADQLRLLHESNGKLVRSGAEGCEISDCSEVSANFFDEVSGSAAVAVSNESFIARTRLSMNSAVRLFHTGTTERLV